MIRLGEKEGDIFDLMLHSGVLTVAEKEIKILIVRYKLRITNMECYNIFEQIANKLSKKYFPSSGLSGMSELLISGNVKTLCLGIQKYIVQSSYYDFTVNTTERYYHVFIFGSLFVCQHSFHILSNVEFGEGRPDLLLIPKSEEQKIGYIFEFKSCGQEASLKESCQDALNQIVEKKYIRAFDRYSNVKTIKMIGMSFCNRKMAFVLCEYKIKEGTTLKEVVSSSSRFFDVDGNELKVDNKK